jgi:hypothetical protein
MIFEATRSANAVRQAAVSPIRPGVTLPGDARRRHGAGATAATL